MVREFDMRGKLVQYFCLTGIHAVTIRDIRSLELFQVHPSGKSRMTAYEVFACPQQPRFVLSFVETRETVPATVIR